MTISLKKITESNNVSGVIDIVRGLAILIVIMVHLRNSIFLSGGFKLAPAWFIDFMKFLDFGNSGVGLFFLISGFLLDFLYRKNFVGKKYAVRRLGRIFPAWLLWNIVAVVIAWLGWTWFFQGGDKMMRYVYGSSVAPTSLPNIAMIVASIFFMGWTSTSIWNRFVPGGWSIQTEVYHYLLFPVFNKIKLTWVLSFLFVMQLGMISFNVEFGKSLIISAFLTSPYWFVCGVLLSRIVRRLNNVSEEKEISKPVNLFLFVGSTALTLTLDGPFVSQWITMVVVLVGLCLAILLQQYVPFVNKKMKDVGTYSYGIYFNHFIFVVPLGFLIGYMSSFAPKELYLPALISYSVVGFFIAIALGFMVAKIMYKFYEKPMLDKARKI